MPEEYISHIKIDYSQWNDFDYYGNKIECDKRIRLFIEEINQKCIKKFEKFISNKLEESKNSKDYEELLKLYKRV